MTEADQKLMANAAIAETCPRKLRQGYRHPVTW
jgi:hypothetical protein